MLLFAERRAFPYTRIYMCILRNKISWQTTGGIESVPLIEHYITREQCTCVEVYLCELLFWVN